MIKELIEKYQVVFYLMSIVLGVVLSNVLYDVEIFEKLIWFFLAVLLYSTFLQIPLNNLYYAFLNKRFIIVAIIVNFLVVPLFVWVLISFLPDDLGVKLGVLLVLLMPCTDWFITFSHLGKGDTKIAIAFTPISLMIQIFLLPIYVLIFLGRDVIVSFSTGDVLKVFTLIIVLPLALAFLTQKFLDKLMNGKISKLFSYLPVPMLSVVIFVITLTQFEVVFNNLGYVLILFPIFILFLVFSLFISKFFSTIFALKVMEGRVLAFSVSTRNSFLVLPISLVLPEPLVISSVVIVFQSLIELLGMILFVWLIPNVIFKE